MTDQSEDSTDPPLADDGPDEFPSPDELPDEPVSVDEVSPFDEDPSNFEDIDEFATAEWKASTKARERVQEVVKRTASPKTASEIAGVAMVSTTTAREKLNDLAEDGIVLAEPTSNGRVYQRDPDWYLMQRVRQLSQTDSLVDHIQALQQELNDYRDEFGTDLPEEVIVSDGVLSEEELQKISNWRTAKRNLTFLRAAYRFREARQCTLDDGRPTDGDDERVSPLD